MMNREHEKFAIKKWSQARGYRFIKDFYFHRGDGDYWSFYHYDPKNPDDGFQFDDITIEEYFCHNLPLEKHEEGIFVDTLFTVMKKTYDTPFKAKDLLVFVKAKPSQWLEAYYKTFQKIAENKNSRR